MEQEKRDAIKAKIEAQNKIAREERNKRIKEYWDNLPRFNDPNDIPILPRVEKKEWQEFYVPRLIAAGAIPKKDLIHDQIYIGDHRNTTIARWNAITNKFDHMRYKFGWTKDDCNHFEDDDGFALFVPIKLGTEKDWEDRIADK
jgi:hypothetical protein